MLKYLAAIVLLGHGIGHLTGFLKSWTSIDVGFSDKPWLLPGERKMNSSAGRAFGILWLICILIFVMSSIGIFMGEEWWRAYALIGSAVSLVAILPWWNTVMVGVKAGALLDVAIILVLLIPAGERVTDFFELP